MPLDKKAVDSLLEEIKWLDENEFLKTIERYKRTYGTNLRSTCQIPVSPLKRKHLLPTEKQIYFQLSHYFRLVMVSIVDPGIGLEIWLRGILPKLLTRYAIDLEEWERITNIGDTDDDIQEELVADWQNFYKTTIRKGKIEDEFLAIIGEGRIRAQKKLDSV
ncbi:MAG: hypothetical protein ACFFFG_00370 [Candidatus Thorarchaeota archaeon]